MNINEVAILIDNSKNLKDMELKQYILKHNLHKLYSKSLSVNNLVNDLGVYPDNMSTDKANEYLNIHKLFNDNKPTAKVCDNLNSARRQRNKRLSGKINNMLTVGECSFLTLTFTPNTVSNTNELTRRRYVTRYLKSQSEHYIANIDYGNENGTEHYHAVIFGRVDFEPWRKYGNVNGKRVRFNGEKDTIDKLTKYVTKLTNHAIKNTCRNTKVIYSKNWHDLAINSYKKELSKNDKTFELGLDLFGNDLKLQLF